MPPNFYINTPLEGETLFLRMKERLSTPEILHEIRALDTLAHREENPQLSDRMFLVPMLLRKIQTTLEDRRGALMSLSPPFDLFSLSATQMSADASELIWRNAWQEASSDAPINQRLSALQTAGKALVTIESWLEKLMPLLALPPHPSQA
jgi:hypothetical protein